MKTIITLCIILLYTINIIPTFSFDDTIKEDYLYNLIDETRNGIPNEDIENLDNILILINDKKIKYSKIKYSKIIIKLNNILYKLKENYKNDTKILKRINYLIYNIKLINKNINSELIFKSNKTLNNINNELINQEVYINYNNQKIISFINKPEGNTFDAVIIFHGTTMLNSRSKKSAEDFSKNIGKKITDKKGLLTISIAYEETNKPIGDELKEAKSAYVWLRNHAKYQGLNIGKIYLLGHSRGGYIVHALNTMYYNDGIIANGGGPIDLGYICMNLRETAEHTCSLIEKKFGTPYENSEEFYKRSLLDYINNSKAKMLIIQGSEDATQQMDAFPQVIKKLENCKNCPNYKIVNIEGVGHYTFNEDETWQEIYNFLN